MNAPSAPHEPRHARWLFASVPLAVLLAALAAWWVPDIGFFEAWPALVLSAELLRAFRAETISLGLGLAMRRTGTRS